MDQLARYVAGPLSLGSLGVALWGVDLPVPAFVAWALATAWAVAALIAWRQEHLDLKGRAIRLANRVRRCGDGWWDHPDFRPHSVYGHEVSMAEFFTGMQRLRGRLVRPFW